MIWRQFLSAEKEINDVWKEVLGHQHDLSNLPHHEYNRTYYLHKPEQQIASKGYINILHLSDIHLANLHGDLTADQKKELKGFEVEKYSNLLQKYLKCLESVDFLIVSGDITFKGINNGFEKFDNLVLEMKRMGIISENKRIILVPGNHDVNDDERLKKFKECFYNKFVLPVLDEDFYWFNSKEIIKDTAMKILSEKIRRESKKVFGWPHNLKNSSVENVGTAFGLKILKLTDYDLHNFQHDISIIIMTLINRKSEKGWLSSKPQNIKEPFARPDVTAWILESLHMWNEKAIVTAGIQDLLSLINDNIGKTIFEKYTFPVSLVLRVLSGIAPTEEKIGELSDILFHRAKRNSGGNIIGWYRHKDIRNHAEPSLIHTAHAVITLSRVFFSTAGKYGINPRSLKEVKDWMLEQPEWNYSKEEIPFCIETANGSAEHILTVWHYTKPWVVMALLEMGINPSNNKITNAMIEIMEDQDPMDKGFWNLRDGERVIKELPIWATYDALLALIKYTEKL